MKYESRTETRMESMAIAASSKFYPPPHIMGSSLHLTRCWKAFETKNREYLLDGQIASTIIQNASMSIFQPEFANFGKGQRLTNSVTNRQPASSCYVKIESY
jgi:hypothetical protein